MDIELDNYLILSGQLVINEHGRFYFDVPGNWFENDRPVYSRLHRIDGPAIERADGTQEWWVDGQRHRTVGPAIERVNGTCEWYLNGQRHRTGGPAIEWADGDQEWWEHGKHIF